MLHRSSFSFLFLYPPPSTPASPFSISLSNLSLPSLFLLTQFPVFLLHNLIIPSLPLAPSTSLVSLSPLLLTPYIPHSIIIFSSFFSFLSLSLPSSPSPLLSSLTSPILPPLLSLLHPFFQNIFQIFSFSYPSTHSFLLASS